MQKRYECRIYEASAEGKPCRFLRREKQEKGIIYLCNSNRREGACPYQGTPGPNVLEVFGDDLTRRAKKGELDPVILRPAVTGRVVRLLCRRTKNNPILVGEAGVGKTAIAEGLAQRLATGDIKGKLSEYSLVSVDLSAVQAGAQFKGDFGRICKKICQEAIDSAEYDDPVMLFIDEFQVLAGEEDSALAAVKPFLVRGNLRILAATTTAEYRKVIEKDSALERRLAPVMVKEPTKAEALEVLKTIRENYELFHGLKISDGALSAAVNLSARYLPDRQLPDKAVDLLDEAASKLMRAVENGAKSQPLSEEMVAEVLEEWTGVPVSRMLQSESQRLLDMEKHIAKRLIGQEEAVSAVASAVRRSRAGTQDPNRPTGSFLFLGPTGVGKTELARALAEFLFETEHAMVRLDMSEYQEKHSVSRLFGSPPGYVGYDEGGQLTEAVRRRPYSVVLFDEIEKAHQNVFDALLQILDDGRLTDGRGRIVDFKNTIIIMTSNVGSQYIADDFDSQTTRRKLMDCLAEVFRPEFLNRLDDIVVFERLTKLQLRAIVDIQLQHLENRLASRQLKLKLTARAKDYLADIGYSPVFGARPLKRAIQNHVQDPLANGILSGIFKPGTTIKGDLEGRELIFA